MTVGGFAGRVRADAGRGGAANALVVAFPCSSAGIFFALVGCRTCPRGLSRPGFFDQCFVRIGGLRMMLGVLAVGQLRAVREQFGLSAAGLDESMSSFRPAEGMMSVAQHVAHAAQVIDWLLEGAFRAEAFDVDFEPQIVRSMEVSSLAAARDWFEESMAQAIGVFEGLDDQALLKLLPEGPVLGGMPRLAIAGAIAEHTSHHRGALAVYARLNHVAPQSPYGM